MGYNWGKMLMMNKLFRGMFIGFALFAIVSCNSHKTTSVNSKMEKSKSLEGEKVIVETTTLQGIKMVETLNENGNKTIKIPYKWYAGIGEANDKQTAIELAEREARATISRIIENAVLTESERGSVANNGDVQKALTSHWKQVSTSVQNACEPIGDTKIEFNPSTKMYSVTAKVGIRGDRFQQLLNSAGSFRPSNLSGDELQQFIDTNKSIMEVAKGN